MKKKLYICLNILLLILIMSFSFIGFYQLFVKLEDEIGLFFISLSGAFVLILVGMNIERLFWGNDNAKGS